MTATSRAETHTKNNEKTNSPVKAQYQGPARRAYRFLACSRRTLCLFCSASDSTRPRQCLLMCKRRRAMSHADRRESGAWTNTAPRQKPAFAIVASPPVVDINVLRGPIIGTMAGLTTTAAMHTRVLAPHNARKTRLETARVTLLVTPPAVATMAATAAAALRGARPHHRRRLSIAHAAPRRLQRYRKRGRGQKMGSAGTATRRITAEIAGTLTKTRTDISTTIAATNSLKRRQEFAPKDSVRKSASNVMESIPTVSWMPLVILLAVSLMLPAMSSTPQLR